MRYFSRRLLLFTSLFFCLHFLFNSFWLNRKNYYWGDGDLSYKLEYLGQSKENFNSIFFGTSRFYYGLNPELFDSLNNLSGIKTKTYNISSNGLFAPASLFQLEKTLENDAFKNTTIFFEISNFDHLDKNIDALKTYYWLNFKYLRFCIKYIYFDDQSALNKAKLMSRYIEIYLRRLIGLGYKSQLYNKEKNVEGEPDKIKVNSNGFICLEDLMELDKSGQLMGTRLKFEAEHPDFSKSIINPNNQLAGIYNEVYKRKLLQLYNTASKNGISLFFVFQPFVSEQVKVFSVFKEMPEISKIDLSQESFLYDASNHFDDVHLNMNGAKLMTGKLAEIYLEKVRLK